MAIIRYNDPFQVFDDVQKMFDDFWTGSTLSNQQTLNAPVSDVYTEGEGKSQKLVVEAHLPNFNKDEVNIGVHEGVLEISAEHKEKDEKGKGKRKYVVRESSSNFYRRIGLPRNIDSNKVAANFENGVLKVTVPYKDLPKPKKISISSGKSK